MRSLKLLKLSRNLPEQAKKICRKGHHCSVLIEDLKRMKREGTTQYEAPSIILELRNTYSNLEYLYISKVRENVEAVKKGEKYIKELEKDMKRRRGKFEAEIKGLPAASVEGTIPWANIVTIVFFATDLLSLVTDVIEESKREWVKRYNPPKGYEVKRMQRYLSRRLKIGNKVSRRVINYILSEFPKNKGFVKSCVETVDSWYDKYIGKYLTESDEKILSKKYDSLYKLILRSEEFKTRGSQIIKKDSSIRRTGLNTVNYITSMDKSNVLFQLSRLDKISLKLEKKYTVDEVKNKIFGLGEKVKKGFWKIFTTEALLRAGVAPRVKIEEKVKKAIKKKSKKRPKGGGKKSEGGEKKKEKATS